MANADAAGSTVTARVASFALHALPGPLPPVLAAAARRAVLDSLAVTVAGASHSASVRLRRAVAGSGHGGACRVLGTGERTDAATAALLNGASAHVLDWDDTILPTRAHLGAALLPPLLALGELRGWTVGDVLPALVVGFEVAARLNHAVYPAIHERGWQGTGMVGGVGAAVAVGRLLGLDAAATAHAIGIAATGGAGLIATFGSMAKALNIGRAAACGLQSALLAAEGFTSHPDMLGTGRFLEMVDDAPRHALLLHGLGERWSITENGYKLYPCGFVAHAAIDAVRELRAACAERNGLSGLVVRVSPESMQLMANPAPRNELEAKFSILYDAAVAWVDGNVTPASFEAEAVRDPRFRAVMALTTIEVSAGIRQDQACAEARFADGPPVRVEVAHARGTAARPLTDDDLADKWDAAMRMGGCAAGPALGTLLADAATPVATLTALLEPQPG